MTYLVLVILGWGGLQLFFMWLDRKVEIENTQKYEYHSNGIIKGLEPQSYVNGHKTAVVFIHGYTDSPEVFDQLSQSLANTPTDWFIPLLPYHGRHIHEMLDFDPYIIQEYVARYVEEKQREYDRVVLVGQSMGGAILIRIAKQHSWDPQKVQLVLLAPALLLEKNSWWYHIIYTVYPWFKNYLYSGENESADAFARRRAMHAKGFRYHIAPSVKRLFQYARDAKKDILKLQHPYTLFIASNDNRISTQKLLDTLEGHASSKVILLNGGKHQLYWSQHVPQIAEHLKSIIP